MNLFSRTLLASTLTLILLTSACNLPVQTPPVAPETIAPDVQATSTAIALVPVTGTDIVALQCQFCVNDEIHAVLLVEQSATFLVSEPVVGINCLTAQVVNGRRIVICRGAQQTSFTMNVCIDGVNCSQLPVTLEACPIVPQTGAGTQQAAPTVNVLPTGVAPTVLPTLQSGVSTPTTLPTFQSNLSTPTPVATQTGPTRSPFTATPGSAIPPRTTPPAVTLPPASGVQDPEGFIRWYFDTVWRQRNYQDLWNNYLTPSYKTNVGSGDFTDYVGWWESVERVEIQSVSVLENDGTQASVRVHATFYMRDGRVVPSQAYDYDLLYDATRGTWMFDYRI